MQHTQHSEFLSVADYHLHLRVLEPMQPCQGVVLMLHGAIENGRIFYSAHGRGLGCFLADHGYRVYCVDFAGRGLSKPHVRQGFQQNQWQMIAEDIPTLITSLSERHQQPLHLMAHSWGGVVALAALIRQPTLQSKVRSQCYFGSKRQIQVRSWQKTLTIDWIWNRLAPSLAKRYGYLPARRFRLGADDEPQHYLLDTIFWIQQPQFVDPTDGFDYGASAKTLHWMPTRFYAGSKDRVLGHPADVRRLMAETGLAEASYCLLSKENGFAHDYGHIDMLTHPSAPNDHFQGLLAWLSNPHLRSDSVSQSEHQPRA